MICEVEVRLSGANAVSDAHLGERPSVQALVKDKDTSVNKGGVNPYVGSNKKEKKTRDKMKLNLLFIAMDLLTLLAYPVVFLHGKVSEFFKSKERSAPDNLLVTAGR